MALEKQTWEQLEMRQYQNTMALSTRPPMIHKFVYENEIKNTEDRIKIQMTNEFESLPKIIDVLHGFYKLTPFAGSKPYLDARILNYKMILDKSITDKPVKEKKVKEVKPKKKTISAAMKRLVWNTNIGEEIGKEKCVCCKSTDITQMSFHCGHIIAEINGGETIVSNLKPICQNCNSSMATKNMNEFMESLK